MVDTREPMPSSEVKVYLDFPKEYEKIALVEASSEFAFKNLSIDITWQDKTDKIIERLKIEASSLGAYGIVIKKLMIKPSKLFLQMKLEHILKTCIINLQLQPQFLLIKDI